MMVRCEKKGELSFAFSFYAGGADGTRLRSAGRGIPSRGFPSIPKPCSPQGEHSYNNMLAERTGLEPATPDVTGRYSNQLNYHS